jgi:hypothetical protein
MASISAWRAGYIEAATSLVLDCFVFSKLRLLMGIFPDFIPQRNSCSPGSIIHCSRSAMSLD